MRLDEIITWAESKNCVLRRKRGHCDHEACDQNERVIAALRKAVRFSGKDKRGRAVSGWLLPDR